MSSSAVLTQQFAGRITGNRQRHVARQPQTALRSAVRSATGILPFSFNEVPLFAHNEHPPNSRPRNNHHAWPIQARLEIGAVNDPLEREADRVADRVMRMPDISGAVSPSSGEVVQRKCSACADEDQKKKKEEEAHEKLSRKESGGAAALDGTAAPPLVQNVLSSAGQPLDPVTRAFMEPRFGHDFGQVRVHTDSVAAESARAVRASAYTVGSHVVFASESYQPKAETGRRLLAHELAHAVQQGSAKPSRSEAAGRLALGTAAGAQEVIARQVTESDEDKKDPACPPDRPYRLAPKRGPGFADPAVVPICTATPMTIPRPENPLIPKQDQPTPPADQPAPPTATPEEPKVKPPETAIDKPVETKKEEVTGKPSGTSKIRVRPGPVGTTLIRPSPQAQKTSTPAPVNCSAFFESPRIAAFGGKAGPWKLDQLVNTIVPALSTCELAYVMIDVVPNATGDDPRQEAIEKAEMIRKGLIQWIGPGKFTEDRFQTGLSSGNEQGAEVEVYLQSRGRVISWGTGGGGPSKRVPQTPKPIQGWQTVLAAGGQVAWHVSLATGKPASTPQDVTMQFQAARNFQAHAKGESGSELQGLVQFGYNITTKQVTVQSGAQFTEVFALFNDLLELSGFVQVIAGVAAGGGAASGIIQPSIGGQAMVQIGNAQIGIMIFRGVTIAPGGESTQDTGVAIGFQYSW